MKLLTVFMICLLSGMAWAAGSVEIRSQQMAVDHLHNKAIFKGGVHLIRDDFDLRCDRLVAYYQDNILRRAEAFGRVRMQQGRKHGASDQAIFDQRNQMLTLIGKASVEDADGVIRGEKIIHNIKTEHTEVLQGSNGRVSMSIESDDGVKGKP